MINVNPSLISAMFNYISYEVETDTFDHFDLVNNMEPLDAYAFMIEHYIVPYYDDLKPLYKTKTMESLRFYLYVDGNPVPRKRKYTTLMQIGWANNLPVDINHPTIFFQMLWNRLFPNEEWNNINIKNYQVNSRIEEPNGSLIHWGGPRF